MSQPRPRPHIRFSHAAGLLMGVVLLPSTPGRALDFQLHSASVEEDGFLREQWFFQNDAKTRVLISLPGGWSHTDDAGSLTLLPPHTGNSMVRIEKSGVGVGVPFQGQNLDVYRKSILAGVPQGAVSVRLGEETADPLPVFNWKTYEFSTDYEFFGQSYRRSMLYVNLNTREQLVMTVVAGKADFERVHAAGMDVLRSWQVMPALQ